MLTQELVNTAVQAAVVFFIAAIFYLFAGRNRGNYFRFIGLYAPTAKAMKWALILALVIVPLSLVLFMTGELKDAASGGNTIAGQIRDNGWSAETIAVIIVMAGFKTSFTEEIFFRGIIAKRFIKWMGMLVGNTLHAAIFAGIHLLIFVIPGGPEFSWVVAGPILAFTGTMAWSVAYLNERIGNGSIVPSWFIHALGNLLAYPVLAFA